MSPAHTSHPDSLFVGGCSSTSWHLLRRNVAFSLCQLCWSLHTCCLTCDNDVKCPPPKKNVKRDSCIPQVSRWFIFSINYQSSVLIPRCCTGEGCVKVIKVSQFYWVKWGRRRRTTESFTNLTKWNQSAAGFTSEPATRQHVYFWINEYHPFFFPELFWIHKSEAVFQKHSNSEAHLMHPQLTSTLSSL